MTDSQFLAIKKLTACHIIRTAAKHNLREIAKERGSSSRIDAARIPLNQVLRGSLTADGVAKLAKALLVAAGIETQRKNQVRGLEIIIGLPAETTIDQERFFADAVQWVEQAYGAPILSAVVHRDEAAPHCHILLLPLVGRRMIGSDLMGGPATLEARQADFHAKVGKRYGLALPAPRKRYSAWVLNKAMEMLVASFMANSGLQAHIVRVTLAKHAKDPEPLLKAMKMEMPREPSGDTFVGIMTRPVKPDRTEWAPAARRPTGEEYAVDGRENTAANDARAAPEKTAAPAPEKTQTLSCVGFRISGHAILPDQSQQSDGCMQRERVGDIGLDAEGIDRSSFAGSNIGAELPAAAQLDQGKPDAAVGQVSDRNRATLLCAPASASATTTGLHGIAPGRHAERQATPTTARGSRAAVMAGKSDARCNALQRTETQRNALQRPQRDGSYCATQDDTAAFSAIRASWASALAKGENAMRQPGVSVVSLPAELLPATPQFQGVLHAGQPTFPTAHRKGALRPRHATTPSTARRTVIESGSKRKKRPVVRYSAVPWHGIAAIRDVPQHRGKVGAAGCMRTIPDCMQRNVYESCTERGDLWTNRVRSVTGCCRRPKNE